LNAGQLDAALDAVRRGLAAANAIGDGGAKYLPYLLIARGEVRGKMHDPSGEAEDCGRVLAMQEERGMIDANAVYDPDALTCLGEADLPLHRPDAALRHLERSVSLARREDPADLPKAHFVLACALRATGRDAARARVLARTARDELARLPGK